MSAAREKFVLGPLLVCGHYAQPKERLRPGTEKWCDTCCCWREAK